MKQTFEAAPLDPTTRSSTVFFVVVVVLVTAVSTIGSREPAAYTTIPLAGAILVGAAWGFAPHLFEIEDGRLRIRRTVFGAKEFVVKGPAESWEPSRFGLGGLRLAGSGGAFGWYGRFWRRDLGMYRAYITDRSNLVAVPTERGLVVISPAEPERFMRALGASS